MEGAMSSPIDMLIVEDDPDDLALVLRALRRCQLADRVATVHDGAEALEFLFCTGVYAHRYSEARPRVILLDLKLPKMTGLEVLQRVKADSRTKAIPVVIFTSSAQERDVVESYDLGVSSYIVKPLHLDDLTEAVCQIGLYWLRFNRTAAG
jgi:two-component system response regulator